LGKVLVWFLAVGVGLMLSTHGLCAKETQAVMVSDKGYSTKSGKNVKPYVRAKRKHTRTIKR
jgi:hypothetical protein